MSESVVVLTVVLFLLVFFSFLALFISYSGVRRRILELEYTIRSKLNEADKLIDAVGSGHWDRRRMRGFKEDYNQIKRRVLEREISLWTARKYLEGMEEQISVFFQDMIRNHALVDKAKAEIEALSREVPARINAVMVRFQDSVVPEDAFELKKKAEHLSVVAHNCYSNGDVVSAYTNFMSAIKCLDGACLIHETANRAYG